MEDSEFNALGAFVPPIRHSFGFLGGAEVTLSFEVSFLL
jgi:hypothetical protein